MKRICSLLVAGLLTSSVAMAIPDRPLLMAVPVRHVFIPGGFDDNDDIQVVLEGSFPDTCYRLAHTEVIKSADGLKLEIVQWARKFPGICIPTTVPFKSEVSLGRLPVGTYQLESVGVKTTALNVIHAAANSQDEYLYAPVSQTSVSRKNSGHYVATLSGKLPNSCFAIDKTDVVVNDNVLVILPILTYEDHGECGGEAQSFQIDVPLPSDLEAGKYLVHVRSMSGKAVNAIFFADGD